MLKYVINHKFATALILNFVNIMVWANIEKISPSNYYLISSFVSLILIFLLIAIFKFLK